eukprot:7384270-Prymnesium_polylepis.1
MGASSSMQKKTFSVPASSLAELYATAADRKSSTYLRWNAAHLQSSRQLPGGSNRLSPFNPPRPRTFHVTKLTPGIPLGGPVSRPATRTCGGGAGEGGNAGMRYMGGAQT